MDNLKNVRIVMVDTSHPGNIGSAARAMKTMGLQRLVLVNPKHFPSDEATALAAGAADVLENASVVETFAQAVVDCHLVFGSTARVRGVALPSHDPRQAAAAILSAGVGDQIAIAFGGERSGLSNEDLQRCHSAICIPSDAEYGSLNLAAAVQIVAYELRMAALEKCSNIGLSQSDAESRPIEIADHHQLEGMFDHLLSTLDDIGFLKDRPATNLMQRLRRIFMRANLDADEVMLMRGIFRDAQRASRLSK